MCCELSKWLFLGHFNNVRSGLNITLRRPRMFMDIIDPTVLQQLIRERGNPPALHPSFAFCRVLHLLLATDIVTSKTDLLVTFCGQLPKTTIMYAINPLLGQMNECQPMHTFLKLSLIHKAKQAHWKASMTSIGGKQYETQTTHHSPRMLFNVQHKTLTQSCSFPTQRQTSPL